MDSHTPESDTSKTTDTPTPADGSRRSFLQGAVASGAAALGGLAASSLAHAQTELKRSTISHYQIPATAETVHWGYFSKNLKPLVEVQSGDFVTIETLTHHANDDAAREFFSSGFVWPALRSVARHSDWALAILVCLLILPTLARRRSNG